MTRSLESDQHPDRPHFMDDIPEWARCRDFPFGTDPEWKPLRNAWEFSRTRLQQLADALKDTEVAEAVCCVAVSGSLSRMEAHQGSDVDLLVVIDDLTTDLSSSDCQSLYDDVWNHLSSYSLSSSLQRPKTGGIFSVPARVSRLTNVAARGRIDEDVTPYGQRMQLLLDAQPILRPEGFERLQTQLLTWYQDNHVPGLFDDRGPYHWLWHDIQRYWHSIRARACWLYADDPRRSLEINLKLRSSRLLIVTAMLLDVEDQFRSPWSHDHATRLSHQLRRTPLERTCIRAGVSRDKFLRAYQHVWSDITQLKSYSATFARRARFFSERQRSVSERQLDFGSRAMPLLEENDTNPHRKTIEALAVINEVLAGLPADIPTWLF